MVFLDVEITVVDVVWVQLRIYFFDRWYWRLDLDCLFVSLQKFVVDESWLEGGVRFLSALDDDLGLASQGIFSVDVFLVEFCFQMLDVWLVLQQVFLVFGLREFPDHRLREEVI